ncbi:uncharacterized protein [Rutidosis leptorrhynchoides]|uniref:uncharacterized protein n=1 Tax=Rutidosis leptorrhynchoides TaxID=125765 RepID=UPI003A9A3F86
MSSDDWPDWLPADWYMQARKVNEKKVKCYIDPEGHRFYSKPQVFEHLKKNNNGTTSTNTQNANGSGVDISMEQDVDHANEAPVSGENHTKLTTRSSRKKPQEGEGAVAGDGSPSEPEASEMKSDDSSWLPDGWTMEIKTRKAGSTTGKRFKCYTDPISGQKFFSKPQVLSYLAKINGNAAGQREGSPVPIIATPISAWQSSIEPDMSQSYNTPKVKKNSSGTKIGSARLSPKYEVVSRTPVEGLPSGWIKELRRRTRGAVKKTDPYFIDPLSEYVFFSKRDALRYLESGDVKNCVIKPLKRDMNEDSNLNLSSAGGEMASQPPSKETETPEPLTTNGTETEMKTDEGTIECPKPVRSISGGSFSALKQEVIDWLPEGWTFEVLSKSSGQKYKVFMESASGKKFYSKPQVLSYLSNGSSSNSRKRKENKPVAAYDSVQNSGSGDVGRPKRVKKKNDDTPKSKSKAEADYEEVVTASPADGLPPGWIKEIRTKIYSTHQRRDPFYTDPVSGYIFRSKLDAMRYLETGDVNLCAIRPKIKDKDGNEVTVTGSVQKPATTETDNQLDEGKGGENNDSSTPAKGKASSRLANTPARSSRRVKTETDPSSGGPTEDNGPVPEKQVSGINLEKLADDEDQLCYDIPEDENWPDIDFAVKTLNSEILFNGEPTSAPFHEGSVRADTSVGETPNKVN